jgi:hypothetical protein
MIVARECLIDGNIQGHTLAELFANRAEFITNYPGCTKQDYYLKTVPEIEKIVAVADSQVFCWFEDDLFCQCNFWFVMYLLAKNENSNRVSLVRPSKGNEYSFASMNAAGLALALKNARCLTDEEIKLLGQLWPLYQRQNYEKMLTVVKTLNSDFAFIAQAIDAQIQRLPDASGYGYPQRRLLSIINEIGSSDFSEIFKLFSQEMAIYSFGDLQVKLMLDSLIDDKRN